MFLEDFYNYLTAKEAPTDALFFTWIISTLFFYLTITTHIRQPLELEFSEPFKHELDAYDILKKCDQRTLTLFVTNSIVFTCHSMESYKEMSQAFTMSLIIMFICCLLLFLYTSYRLSARIYAALQTQKKHSILP